MSYFSNLEDNYKEVFLVDEKAKLTAKKTPPDPTRWTKFKNEYQGALTICILYGLYVSNATDRYVVSAVLIDVQDYFQVSKSTTGLLQTIYYLSYMIMSPLVGYLGDRYNRRYLLIFSILLWTGSVLMGSFCTPGQFIWFCMTRASFGVASACFETIAIPIIGDRFANDEKTRNRALVVYFTAPPIGTGLSFIISVLSKDYISSDWRYVMRFTPFILGIVLIALLTVYVEPERKIDESSREMSVGKREYKKDVRLLMRNKTYLLLVLAWVFGLSSLGMFRLFLSLTFVRPCPDENVQANI
jgi:MFS family permease